MADKVEPQTTSSSATEQRSASQAGAGTSERVTPAIGQAPASSSSSNAAASLATPPSTGSAGGGGTGTGAVTPGIAAAAQGAAIAGGETVTGGAKCLDATNPAVWKSLGVEMPDWAPSDPQRAQLMLELEFPGITGGVPGMPQMKTPEEVRENIRNPQPQMYAAPSEEKAASNQDVAWEMKGILDQSSGVWEQLSAAILNSADAPPNTAIALDLALQLRAEATIPAAVVEFNGEAALTLQGAIELVRTDSDFWQVTLSADLMASLGVGLAAELEKIQGEKAGVNFAGASAAGGVSVGILSSGYSPGAGAAAGTALLGVPWAVGDSIGRLFPGAYTLAGPVSGALDSYLMAKQTEWTQDSQRSALGDPTNDFHQGPLSETASTFGYGLAGEANNNTLLKLSGERSGEVHHSWNTQRVNMSKSGRNRQIVQQKGVSETESEISNSQGIGIDAGALSFDQSARLDETHMKSVSEETVVGDFVLDNNGRYKHVYDIVDRSGEYENERLANGKGLAAGIHHGKAIRTTYAYNDELGDWVMLYRRELSSSGAALGLGMDGSARMRKHGRGGGSDVVGAAANPTSGNHGEGEGLSDLYPIPPAKYGRGAKAGVEGEVVQGETIGTETLAYVKQRYMRGNEGGSYVDDQGTRQRAAHWATFIEQHDGSLHQIQQNMIEPESGTPEHHRWFASFGKSDGELCAAAQGSYESWLDAVENAFEQELSVRQDPELRFQAVEFAKQVNAGKIHSARHLLYKSGLDEEGIANVQMLVSMSGWTAAADILKMGYDPGREQRIDELTDEMHQLVDGVDLFGLNHRHIQNTYNDAAGITPNEQLNRHGEVKAVFDESLDVLDACEEVYRLKQGNWLEGFTAAALADYGGLIRRR